MSAVRAWEPTLSGRGRSESVRGLQVTGELFALLGVPAARGRALEARDQGAGQVVVLTDGLWRRRFGADPALVGQGITLDGDRYQVVGVMPAGFAFPPFWRPDAELFVPFDLAAQRQDRSGQSLRVVARLRPGVTLPQARGDMTAIMERLERAYPEDNRGLRVFVESLHDKAVGDVRRPLLVLAAAVLCVLLIACANVANLMLARGQDRQRELAVRASLGASRGRLVLQLLIEAGVLAAAGGGAGVLLAHAGIDLLLALAPAGLPRLDTVAVDGRALVATLALSLAAGLLSGLVPALQLSRGDLQGALRDGGRSSTAGRARGRVRAALVVAEVALALVLLVGGGLLMRSFQQLRAVDAGFDADGVLAADVTLGLRSSDPELRARRYQTLRARLEALPGVESVSAINHLPIGGDMWGHSFTVDGRPPPAPGARPVAVYRVVAPGYFRTMRLPLVRGREIGPQDRAGTGGVVVVNEALARTLWPGEDPIGKRIRVEDDGPDPREIVGVVRDAKQHGWTDPPRPEMYLPYLQNPSPRYLGFVVRTTGRAPLTAAALGAVLDRELAALDPQLPTARVTSMRQVLDRAIRQPRFNLLLLNVFAAVALLLAGVGIYGVVAHAAGRRTQEVGIRLALGARPGQVMALVVGQGLAPILAGLALGLLGALATTHLMAALLFQVSAVDPLTFAAVPLGLLAVALLACYLPARRATRIDPMIALRAD
jgi:putative ABC transport system permease protein